MATPTPTPAPKGIHVPFGIIRPTLNFNVGDQIYFYTTGATSEVAVECRPDPAVFKDPITHVVIPQRGKSDIYTAFQTTASSALVTYHTDGNSYYVRPRPVHISNSGPLTLFRRSSLIGAIVAVLTVAVIVLAVTREDAD